MENKCKQCRKQYIRIKKNQVFCNKDCSNRWWAKTDNPFRHLATGTVGALSELLASADLIKNGYEVYRALSPSSSCDILALKNGEVKKFEVRTSRRNKSGAISYPKTNIRAENIIAVILSSKEIVYIPELIV